MLVYLLPHVELFIATPVSQLYASAIFSNWVIVTEEPGVTSTVTSATRDPALKTKEFELLTAKAFHLHLYQYN